PGRRRGLAERRLHARDRRTDRTLRDAVGSLLDRMLAASRTLVIVEPFTDDAEADDHQAEELITTLATTGNPTLTSGELTATLRGLGAAEVEVRDIGWGFGRFRSAVIATSS